MKSEIMTSEKDIDTLFALREESRKALLVGDVDTADEITEIISECGYDVRDLENALDEYKLEDWTNATQESYGL